jgi:hypothetical protein
MGAFLNAVRAQPSEGLGVESPLLSVRTDDGGENAPEFFQLVAFAALTRY